MWWPFGLLLGATRFGLLSPVALTFIIDKTTNINIFFFVNRNAWCWRARLFALTLF